MAITTPAAKLFACLHIVVSVSWLAALIGWIDRLSSNRTAQLKRAELVLKPPDLKAIMKMNLRQKQSMLESKIQMIPPFHGG